MKANWKIFRLLTLYIIAFLLFSLAGCEKTYPDEKESTGEEQQDYTWDTSQVVQIRLDGSSINVSPSAAAKINGTTVTITSGGTYMLTGKLDDGQILVDAGSANVKLVLNGADIHCSHSAPIFISKARKTVIILNDGSSNKLADGTTYNTAGEPNATLFSNSYLSFSGNGSLDVQANYNDGISGDDGVLINSGTISVTSKDDGIRGKDFIYIRDANIQVRSQGDGLKSDNETESSAGYITIEHGTFDIIASAGDAIDASTKLTIADGNFTIKTGNGGVITSGSGGGTGGFGGSSGYSSSVSEKALKGQSGVYITTGTFAINSADDAIHSKVEVKIDNGTFTIASGDDAIHADKSVVIKDGTLTVSLCYEGIESASITIEKGQLHIASADDTFNASAGQATEANDGSMLTISGGYVVLSPTSGDGIDCNGNVTMTGGTVIVHGPSSQPELGFDVNGTFNISGGIFLATGPNSGNMIETPSATSSQNSVKFTSSATISSSTLIHLADSEGNDLFTYKPVRSVYYLVFSSANLTNGKSFSVYTGGSSTGTLTDGLYSGGVYTGGTLKQTFTVSSRITNVSF